MVDSFSISQPQALPNNGGSNAMANTSNNLPLVNQNLGFNSNVGPAPAPSTTMDASAIQGSTTTPSFHFPTATPSVGTSAQSANSANTSIPTPQSIIQQETQPTPAEATNTSLLQKVAALMQGKTSLATNQTNAESAAGIPAMTKTVNDLSTQIQGLADQSTALQNAAGAGGTIDNQEQNAATGRGITAGGLAPLHSADLRNNQIQQASIAAQALTLKSAYYAANGNLTLAKDAADKAGQVQFDAEVQQIDYMNSLIEANKPQMTKEEKGQADLVAAQLADRTNAINNAKADKVTGVGLAAAAMKNNPNDAAAQYAAQQVLAMNPDDPNYLNKVALLVGKYQQDPNAVALQIAQINNERANTAKTLLDTKISRDAANGNSTVPVQNGDGSTSQVPANVAPYYNTSHSGVGYVDASTLQGTAAQKTAIVNQAQKAGLKVITNKNTATDLFNIGDANNKLDTVLSTLANIDQPSALSRDLYGLGLTTLAVKAQSDPQQAASGALSSIGTDILKAMQGVQGSRMSQAAVANITKELPTVYDTNATVQAKVQNLQKLLNDREDAILGKTGTNGTNQTTLMTGPDGKSYNVPNDKVAAFKAAGGK